MCLAAIYWARCRKVYYANTQQEAAEIQFDDTRLYREVAQPIALRESPMKQLLHREALEVFAESRAKPDKTQY